MTQGSFNYESEEFRPEEEFIPDWLAQTFLERQDTKCKKCKVMAVLRERGLPTTQKELAPAIYPNAFDNRYRDPEVWYRDGYKLRSTWIDTEERHIKKTGAIIRSIDYGIRSALSQFESREEKLEYLRNTPLVIRVGDTESGEALYAYHGPDSPQPIEVLDDYVSWAETHQTKQSQPLVLAQNIRDAAVIQGSIFGNQTLDPDDLPNEEDEIDKWDDLEENQ